MGSSPPSANNPTIVAAFRSSLVHQALVLVVIAALLAIAWNVLRSVELRRALGAARARGGQPVGNAGPAANSAPVAAAAATSTGAPEPAPEARERGPGGEPSARRLLRIAFGLLWVFDGLLQAQVSMPLGLVPQVIKPGAATSPGWVQHLVNVGTTIWSYHPVTAAASVVWIQAGIGLWLLVAPRGDWSRAAGVVSAGWGAVVWVFGESFGGTFAPGLSWLFGAPGAAVFYVVAGILVALPERVWHRPTAGRVLLRLLGVFFVGMAVLQAWPGRGFWKGGAGGPAAPLVAMVRQMSRTSQPRALSSLLSSFASFDSAHGFAVNLFVVVALAAIGVALCSGRPAVLRWAVPAALLLCLADWVLVEDFGFLGGVGTDPGSMLPLAVLLVAGYLAVARAPASVRAPAVGPDASSTPPLGWRTRWLSSPTYALRSLAAIGAVAITILGAAPMVAATTNRVADPILYDAIDGSPGLSDVAAPPFSLVDQHGGIVSLAGLRGKVVALTFLDPVCTSSCPLIAQEFKQADAMLGGQAAHAEFIAIVANPVYRSIAAVDAFTRTEGLARVGNWLFLTGSEQALNGVWSSYGVQVSVERGGAMIGHGELAYLIDRSGRTREVLNADPGQGGALGSSFAGIVAGGLRRLLGAS
jgi:cytochrome oxidase Cu insertion factor (SCO1/SenC/PrrC family)